MNDYALVLDDNDALRELLGLILSEEGYAVRTAATVGEALELIRQQPKWANYFPGYRKPYLHLTPDEYQTLAKQHGFQVLSTHVADKTWDFKTREGFVAFAEATFVEWTRLIPDTEKLAFITDVLNLYQTIAADSPAENNAFKFYQMEIELSPHFPSPK